MKNLLLLVLTILAFAACQSREETSSQTIEEIEVPQDSFSGYQNKDAHKVYAIGQTEAVRSVAGEDAADDPAFWLNSSVPAKSLIIGSNKREGIEVYNLEGLRLAYYPTGRINNVDVVQNVKLGVEGAPIDLVAGSNRTYNRIDVWQIDPTGKAFTLISDTAMRSQLAEVYGFCLYRASENEVYAFVNGKSGKVEQYKLTAENRQINFELVGNFAARSQTEGIVVDTEADKLYLGVEEQGILLYNIKDGQVSGGHLVPMTGSDNLDLRFDIEGLTIYYGHNGERYLLASSQGNNRFAVYNITNQPQYLSYFEVADNQVVDAVSETDGIHVFSGNLGAQYPKGLFIAQDGYNQNLEGRSVPQNFKMISMQDVLGVVLE